MGSPIYEGHQPTADASCVALARRAGAVILGKTVTCEFAGMQPNVTSNPHNPAYTPGGSSSGSAAAVADHMVPLAYGTQTGGSIIRPASFCGVVGYKPTYGRINRAGLKFAAESLDTIGFMGRSVDDVQLMLEAHVGKFAPFELGNNLKFGVCRTYLWDEKATDETDRVLNKAVDVLKDVAVEIVDFDLSTTFWDVTDHRNVIDNVERAYGMAHEWNAHKDQLSDVLAGRIELGLGTDLDDYEEAKIWLEQIRPALAPAMKGLDALITPAVLGEAPEGSGLRGIPVSRACGLHCICRQSRCRSRRVMPACRSVFN